VTPQVAQAADDAVGAVPLSGKLGTVNEILDE
jgi:hypothetical protein